MVPTITPEAAKSRELFLVEGESAASTVRQAMKRDTQDVFAVQGKIINAGAATMARVEANPVCAALFAALGCGVGERCDPVKLSYSRVIILTDPDVDGAHARALLATLFARCLRPLVQRSRVFAVLPPVWRIDGLRPQSVYAWSDEELRRLRSNTAGNNAAAAGVIDPPRGAVTRFRGVAQFSLPECSTLLLDPATRRQVQLSLATETQ